jgi:hypothetical protein
MKKLHSLIPLLALVAFAAIPAAAQALPHWYKKGVIIGSSPVTVVTSGAFTVTTPSLTVKCKLSDSEEIWNPASGGPGQDLMTSFTFAGCKNKASSAACPKNTAEVLPNGLPWPSHLISSTSSPTVIRDEIQKMRLIVRCLAGTVPFEYEGSLTPEVGNGALIFGGPGGGALLEGGINPLTLTGKDKMTAPPGKITAQDP